MVSMSTTSSSFSRSSHDRFTNDNASQYSRGTNFSAMSDGSSACDLSRDPDILALAGLSMKPRPSEDYMYEPAPVQRPQMLNSKTYEHQVIEEPEREDEAVDQDEEENSFNERTVPTPWPGSNVDARYRSYTTSTRDDLPVPQPNTLRPADVLRHRSQTTAAMAWNPSATAPLSSSSSVKDLSTKSNNFASSSIGRLANNSKPESSTDSNSQFHFSRMNNQPSTTSAAIVAAVTAASSNSTPQDQSSSTSKSYMTSSARRGSVPMQMHRLPASVPEDGSASDDSGRNDMIPLPQSGQMPANFVVFSDSRRESIFTRADDGQDMIPLDF